MTTDKCETQRTDALCPLLFGFVRCNHPLAKQKHPPSARGILSEVKGRTPNGEMTTDKCETQRTDALCPLLFGFVRCNHPLAQQKHPPSARGILSVVKGRAPNSRCVKVVVVLVARASAVHSLPLCKQQSETNPWTK
jgi:hypothetical protein